MTDDLIKFLRTSTSSAYNKTAANRIEELEAKLALMMFERDEAWKRAAHSEKMWGEAEVKLAECEARLSKAVEALRETDQAIMLCTDEIGWLLWGEGAVSDIRAKLAELEGQ